MTKRIEKAFKVCKKENRAAFIPFLTAGYPNPKSFKALMETISLSGADIIEIGIPFSDPLADGATIQKSSQCALGYGINISWIFSWAKEFRKKHDTPLVLMSYFNPIFHFGIENFIKESGKAGIDGVIIPDLPFDEGNEWLEKSKGKLDTIFLVVPTSSKKRIKKSSDKSSGFLYCVSLTGVTGMRKTLPKSLAGFVRKVKKTTGLPVAVGFGISQPSQAKEIANVADGVIIGSALIDLIDSYKRLKQQQQALKKMFADIKKNLKKEG